MRIYLAWSPSPQGSNTLDSIVEPLEGLNLLVSFVYLGAYRRTSLYPNAVGLRMLDSGAFSAWNSGKTVDMDALVRETLTGKWDEAVALDVIRDHEGSKANAIAMKKAGSPAFPVFHYGEPLDLLKFYCDEFEKVGLSCRFGETVSESLGFLTDCFAACWPHKFHSFGWVKRTMLATFPFETADTSSWCFRPASFGAWAYAKIQRSSKSEKFDRLSLMPEVHHYLRLQREMTSLWKAKGVAWQIDERLRSLAGRPTPPAASTR